MSFFYYRWDKCRFLTIGGTNVVFLAIGGTYVDLIEGGTNVGRTNVGGKKVATSFISFSFLAVLLRLQSGRCGLKSQGTSSDAPSAPATRNQGPQEEILEQVKCFNSDIT
jgi:hypothetical protein